MSFFRIVFIFGLLICETRVLLGAPVCGLRTIAELSEWKRTGRYAETQKLASCFEKTYPKNVRSFVYGTTPEGRPMLALAVGKKAFYKVSPGKKPPLPVIFVIAGIHAGEIDGKDAGFWFLRELLDGKILPDALNSLNIVFVPVYNVDGHERFGAYNRPNQIGPIESGWRATAQNYNLNRDYMKLDTPEARSMVKLLRELDPVLVADLHVTDGAEFQVDVSTIFSPNRVGPVPLVSASAALKDSVLKFLSEKDHVPFDVYPSFKVEDQPKLGILYETSPLRRTDGYWALRNRLSVLVETHSWKNYATRVRATRDTLIGLVSAAQLHGDEWLKAEQEADRSSAKLSGKDFTLTWATTEKSREIEFPGYKYKRVKSPVSGREETVYDTTKKEIWKIPLFEELKPKLTLQVPLGYLIPQSYANYVVPILKLHGVHMSEALRSRQADVEVYKASSIVWASASTEGHVCLTVTGKWTREIREVSSTDIWVPLEQPLAPLVMQLLEPESQESFVSWGMLNTPFEKKEYMESYVADQVGREMLAKDVQLRKDFEKRLKNDLAFAKDPAARLEFFYMRHPSWDKMYGVYPIVRVVGLGE